MVKEKIIITGDFAEGVALAGELLQGSDYEPLVVPSAEIRSMVKKKSSDLFIFCVTGDSTDLQHRLGEIKRANESLPIFVIIKAPDVEFVVNCLKRGVNDVFVKPINREIFLKKLARELHLYVLTKKIFMSAPSAVDEYRFEDIIGCSKKMQENFQMITAVARSNATVLVTGESGVGKELVATAIHRLSERKANRIVDINCGAIPRDLLENELFGHEKGSFTGAHKRYIGSFEAAHKGTLFLDEISEMDVLLQVKLLRVLQERSFSRIGGNEKINIDVRIVAATNQNLPKLIERNAFREDLYYRLNVVNVHIPPVRERREDIPLLAKHFLDYYSAKNNRIFMDFSVEAMEALINYDWPGNVRELENTIERLVVLHDTSEVKVKQLPPQIQKVDRAIGYSENVDVMQDDGHIVPLEDLEKKAIEAALIKFHGNIAVAAKKLKIGQATLYRKVKKFGFAANSQ